MLEKDDNNEAINEDTLNLIKIWQLHHSWQIWQYCSDQKQDVGTAEE